MATTTWNLNAREFTPGVGSPKQVTEPPKLRVDAPVFVPTLASTVSVPRDSETVAKVEIPDLVKSKSITLHDELFGDASPVDSAGKLHVLPPATVLTTLKQHISPVLVSQLLVQADKQVLELGNFLATRGLQTGAQDLILIRLQLQQLQSLKTSLQAVLHPVPTIGGQKIVPKVLTQLPGVAGNSHYTALVAQAAQYAMSKSAVSTAATSRKASPQMSPSSQKPSTTAISTSACGQLTLEDLQTLVYRVIEKACFEQQAAGISSCCEIGLPASSLRDEWVKCYPSLSPLSFYMDMFNLGNLKQLLFSEKALTLFYSSLPSPQLRVSTKSHFFKFFNFNHPTAKLINLLRGESSPLISPTSTCSFTSDVVESCALPKLAGTSKPELQRMLVEVMLNVVEKRQVEFLKSSKSVLGEILDLVDSERKKSRRRLLDSKRPPPIDTGGAACKPANAALVQQFHTEATSALQPNCAVAIPDLEAAWSTSEFSHIDFPRSYLRDAPGISLLADAKCVLTGMSTTASLAHGLFSLGDPAIWSNPHVLSLAEKFLKPASSKPTPRNMKDLTELSSILFKSIMAGGATTASECASALKVLAAKDPGAIHQIVSQHISKLKKAPAETSCQEEAANAFITNLMNRGKQAAAYSREELLGVRKGMGSLLSVPPEAVRNLKLQRPRKK